MTKWHFYIKTLKQVSDFHLGRHFFGLVGDFFVGLSVTSQHKKYKKHLTRKDGERHRENDTDRNLGYRDGARDTSGFRDKNHSIHIKTTTTMQITLDFIRPFLGLGIVQASFALHSAVRKRSIPTRSTTWR